MDRQKLATCEFGSSRPKRGTPRCVNHRGDMGFDGLRMVIFCLIMVDILIGFNVMIEVRGVLNTVHMGIE